MSHGRRLLHQPRGAVGPPTCQPRGVFLVPRRAGTAVDRRARAARSIGAVQDPKLQIQMLHDRVMVRVTDANGERRSSAGIVIPATAEVAKRLIWGEVFGV